MEHLLPPSKNYLPPTLTDTYEKIKDSKQDYKLKKELISHGNVEVNTLNKELLAGMCNCYAFAICFIHSSMVKLLHFTH